MARPNLTRYSPSAAHRAAIRASGFDLDNPDRRHPVHTPIADRLRAGIGQNHPTRGGLLLKARHWLGKSLTRTRVVIALCAVPPWMGAPYGVALARPSDQMPVIAARDTAATSNVPADLLPGIGDPIWVLTAFVFLLTLVLVGLQFQLCTIWEATRMTRKSLQKAPVAELATQAAPSAAPLVWKSDGASRMGKVRSDNQDAWQISRVAPNAVLLGVFDGAGGIEGGGEAARNASACVFETLNRCVIERGVAYLTTDDLGIAIASARKDALMRDLTGITTAIVAALVDDRLIYATLGDGALSIIWPDGMVSENLTPHHSAGMPTNIINAFIGQSCMVPPRTGTTRLEPGCTVMAMSDGASDLFPYEEFALAHREQISVWNAAPDPNLPDRILAELEAARDPETGAYLHSDNMTLVAAHLYGGGRSDA